MKYFIKTFGCQMNYSDSERIASTLEKHGLLKTSEITEADLVIFNTCGIRQMAEDRVYGLIHNLKKQDTCPPSCDSKAGAARNKIQTKIILTGCLANRKDVQRRLKNKVDLFCEIKNFPEEFRRTLGVPLDTQCPKDYLDITPKYTNNFSASVPIMTGCNNFCSYCVVPYARGREVSRPVDEILSEIKNLVKNGYKEIILLGQNVNSYSDTEKPIGGSASDILLESSRLNLKRVTNFSQLLKKINALPGKFWIRFVSSHPKDVTSEMIETVAKCKKVCEAFHLPIQAGSDKILQKMNRKYTVKEYLVLVRKIKSSFKKYKPELPAVITSDIIVGFPSETKKQFLASAEVMEKVGFDMVYFGQFSPRPGTVAWKMKDNVSKTEKERREKFLNEILKKTALKNSQQFLNTATEVLIEKMKVEPSDSEGSTFATYFGKTRTGKNVKIVSKKKNLVGKFVKVKIIKTNIWNLEGEIL